MARMTPGLRWKIIEAVALSTAGAIDPLPVEEVIQAAIWTSVAAEVACDPIKCQIDRAYGRLCEPTLPFALPTVGPKDCRNVFRGRPSSKFTGLLNEAIRAQWMVSTTEQAILTTVHRRHTAIEFGDKAAENAQDNHRKQLIKRIKTAQKHALASWTAVLDGMETHKVKPQIITANMVGKYLRIVDERGFPELELRLLRGAGLNDFDIHWMSRIMPLVEPRSEDMSTREIIGNISKINTFKDIYRCTCEH